MNKFVYVMNAKSFKVMTTSRLRGGLGLKDKKEVIEYLNATAGIIGEIIDVEIR